MLGPNRNFNLAIGRAKLRGSAKVAFSVADSEIRWAELVPSRTVLTLSVQNGPACSKSALDKLGPIWPLGSIWLFSFYSVQSDSFNVDQCVFTCSKVTSFIFFFVLDINECSTNSHSCDVNAVCGNTLGSYTCACKPGYSGNGRTCSGKLNSVI